VSARPSTAHTKKRVASSLVSEQTCFRADQKVLVRELRVAETAIEGGATEMAMIAAESVFDEQVSNILNGTARALHRMGRGLKSLRLEVARARLGRHRK
jgi:hypothetical protein